MRDMFARKACSMKVQYMYQGMTVQYIVMLSDISACIYCTPLLQLSLLSIHFLPLVWCSEGWRGWNHNCYYFSQTAAPWTSAQAWCRSHLDSDLVSVASLEENTFILGMNK